MVSIEYDASNHKVTISASMGRYKYIILRQKGFAVPSYSSPIKTPMLKITKRELKTTASMMTIFMGWWAKKYKKAIWTAVDAVHIRLITVGEGLGVCGLKICISLIFR